MPEPSVAVIGAGWAGMAAAVTLADAGASVTVFESADHLGGRARTVDLHGLNVDNGQHILLGAYRETLALIEKVNPHSGEHLLRQPLALAVRPGFLLRTRRLPAPWHIAFALLSAQGLRMNDRLLAMHFLAGLRRLDFRLPQDTPLSALLERYRQTERLNRFLWHPLCLAALNTSPEEASAQVFLNVLRDAFTHGRADSDVILPQADLSTLFPEPAAAFVEERGGRVHRRHRVRAIVQETDGWTLRAGEDTQRFSHVVCATPPQRTAELIETLPEMHASAQAIRALRYQPIYTVYLQYQPGVGLDLPMIGLACGLGQWVFDRGQLGGPAGLLAVVISASGPHEAFDHARLAQEVASQLHTLLGLPLPQWHRVIAEKRATFACAPGLHRPAALTGLRRLYLAGDYVAGDYPATIEGAARSGVQCARHILESQ